MRESGVKLSNCFSSQQQSLDAAFLKTAVTERLKDDVPQVVAAALRVMEVRLLSTVNQCLFK